MEQDKSGICLFVCWPLTMWTLAPPTGDGQRVHPLPGPAGVRQRRRQHHLGSCHSDGHRAAAAGRAHAAQR